MIRDLRYPEDARAEFDELSKWIEYDASVSVMGLRYSKQEFVEGVKEPEVPVRFGSAAEKAVHGDIWFLTARSSLVSMVSRFEIYARRLLLQKRVLTALKEPGTRMRPDVMWEILRTVHADSRGGPVKLCREFLLEELSEEVANKMDWLQGIYKIRNCLAHRLGVVQMEEVKPDGKRLDETLQTDTLRARWLRLKVMDGDTEVIQFPYKVKAGQINTTFEEFEREWKVGDHIVIRPQDSQFIALSLVWLASSIHGQFEKEMNSLLNLK